MKPIREDIAIKEGRYDTHYTLVRTSDGAIHVETFESPNKPFQKGSRGLDILPADFDQHIIDGRSLREHVEDALRRIDSSPA
jgi:hypothetical protein